MELSIQDQIFDQLRKANKILIALPAAVTADSLASGLALKLFLKKLRKDVDVVTSGQVPENLKFLPGSDTVTNAVAAGKSLVVTVHTDHKKLDEISYQTADDSVRIYLKSQGEPFAAEDLSLASDKFPVDVIVTLDASSLETLGETFHNNADLFFETPKINIDHKAGNEFFGTINLVDVTATSVGEMLAGLLEQFEAGLVDEDIATALLTGIITKTQSFQHAHTTPQAFLKASQLVNRGGRQQEIIKHVYKTRSLQLLKLWGRSLARLKTVDELSLAYSSLNMVDFERSEGGEAEVLPAFKELLENISGFKLVALLTEEHAGSTRALLAVHLGLSQDLVLSTLAVPVKELSQLPHFKIFQLEFTDVPLALAEQRLVESLQPLKQTLAAG